MNRQRSRWLVTALVGVGVVVAPVAGDAAQPESAGGGGELVDYGTFALGPPNNIDPALNQTLDAYQVINAMYDGLTDIDDSDPENSRIVPLLAESYEPNEDASVWTFHIRDGMQFADGEAILPSTFQRSWERASSPEMVEAGTYQYLFNFIDGGTEKINGEADTISGVVADDDAMTLTVTLDEPNAEFDAIAGFQLFFPVPAAADENPLEYENGLMVGNGPYTLESPRTDQEIVLVRNDDWAGDFSGETWPDRPERIVLRVSLDTDAAYNAMEAGEGDTGRIPAGRTSEAQSNWGTTTEMPILGTYFFDFDERDADVGGDNNRLLRQAVSQAIDRVAINEAVFNGARIVSTGITPPGVPGFAENLCDYCAYDQEAAQAAFEEWTAAGNQQAAPIQVQFNAGGVHEAVATIIVENLSAIGIQAEPVPMDTETYFDELSAGACGFCRSGWIADYPTYANFLYDNFHQDSIGGGNNWGYLSDEFDALVDEAIVTVDPDERAVLYQQAEQILLNDDIGTVPILWYMGDYAFNPDRLSGFAQNSLGLILWERVTINE